MDGSIIEDDMRMYLLDEDILTVFQDIKLDYAVAWEMELQKQCILAGMPYGTRLFSAVYRQGATNPEYLYSVGIAFFSKRFLPVKPITFAS